MIYKKQPHRGCFFVANLKLCYDLALNEPVFRQTGDLDAGAGGEWLCEILCVHGVDCAEIIHVLDENGGLHYLLHIGACGLEHCGDIFKCLMSLSLNAFEKSAGCGINAKLSRCVDHASDYLSLRVRA